MFPDHALRWKEYPSIIDGIGRPPFVLDKGFFRGNLYLGILPPKADQKCYGVEIQCEMYSAVEELFYSNIHHGDSSSSYDGNVYIKEAESSELLKTYENFNQTGVKGRLFLFVGADYCYECLGLQAPKIIIFNNEHEVLKWKPFSDI